jgi:hypothetical protein
LAKHILIPVADPQPATMKYMVTTILHHMWFKLGDVPGLTLGDLILVLTQTWINAE